LKIDEAKATELNGSRRKISGEESDGEEAEGSVWLRDRDSGREKMMEGWKFEMEQSKEGRSFESVSDSERELAVFVSHVTASPTSANRNATPDLQKGI
jgi:hypothetical protein